MAVTKIVKVPSETSEVGDSGSAETQDWLVWCDDPHDTPAVALTAKIMSGMTIVAQVPPYLSAHPIVTQMVVKSKSAKRHENARNIFKVTVNYAIPGVHDNSFEVRPTGTNVIWNKQITVSGEESIGTTNHNAAGKPIRNSLGDVYRSNAVRTFYDEVININYETDSVNAAAIAAARGKINSNTVTLNIVNAGITRSVTYPPLTLKCGSVQYSYSYDQNGQGRINVSLPLIFRDQLSQDGTTQIGWKQKIVDAGYRYLVSGTITSVDTEAYLDGTGHSLTAGADAILVEEQIDYAINFSSLLSGI